MGRGYETDREGKEATGMSIEEHVEAWSEEGRTEEQIYGVQNFVTSSHFKEWSEQERRKAVLEELRRLNDVLSTAVTMGKEMGFMKTYTIGVTDLIRESIDDRIKELERLLS